MKKKRPEMGAIGHDSIAATALARRRRELLERMEISLDLASDCERAAEAMRLELNNKLAAADRHREQVKTLQEQIDEIAAAYEKLVGAKMPDPRG